MTTLDRKLLRDIGRVKGMLAAVISIIAVGAGCLVGMLSTSDNLRIARDSYYSHCRMADFWIDLKKIPTSDLAEIAGRGGVSEVMGRIEFPVVVDIEGVNEPICGKVISLPEESGSTINGIVMRRGSYFTPERRDEVIVSEKFAAARGLAPGGFLTLVLNGRKQSLFVVGTAISSEFMYLTPPNATVPEPARYGVFWIKREYAEDVFGFHGACNSVVGMLSPEAKQDPRAALDAVERRFAPYGVMMKTPLKDQFSNLNLCSELSSLAMQAMTLPLVFLGVAALVLNVVMLRMAEQQRTIIGTLKALGVRNSAIFAHFLKFGLFVGLAGGVIGCGLGWMISWGMTSMYAEFYTFPCLENHAYASTMLFAVLVAVFFAAMGTLHGVDAILRLSPAESMRPSPPSSGGGVTLERIGWLWRRLGFRWQMVLRGLLRQRGRTAVGVLSAALGSGMVLMSLGLVDSLNYMIRLQFDKVMLADYNISLRDEVGLDAVGEAARMPGVERLEATLDMPCEFRHGNRRKISALTGIAEGAALTVPTDPDGKAVKVPSSGLLMSKRLAEILDIREGGLVEITPLKGERRPVYAEVAGVVDSVFGLPVYTEYRHLCRILGQEAPVSSIQVRSFRSPDDLRGFFKEMKKSPELASVVISEWQKWHLQNDLIAKLKLMTFVMIAFAAVIFFGSILNAALISISERRREISTFRVLGYHSLEVGQLFVRETMLVNLLGTAVGLPIGLQMLSALCGLFGNEMFSVPCQVEPLTWLYSLLLSVAFVLAANVIIQRIIDKLDWPEALKLKE